MDQNQYQTDGAMMRRNTAAGTAAEETQEIDLLMLFNALRKNILAIVAVALAFALCAGIVVQFFITPIYEATTSTYLVSQSGANSLLSQLDLQLSNSIIGDYSDIIKSRRILESLIEQMQLDYTYEELYKNVEVVNPTDTHIIKITVSDPDPYLAAKIANDLTNYVVEELSDIMAITVPNVYDYAIAADKPAFPSLTKTVVIAFVLGAVVAAGVIIFVTVMDTTIKTAEDIENRCGMVTLTKIYMEGGKKKKGYGYGYGYGYGFDAGKESGGKNSKYRRPDRPDKSNTNGGAAR